MAGWRDGAPRQPSERDGFEWVQRPDDGLWYELRVRGPSYLDEPPQAASTRTASDDFDRDPLIQLARSLPDRGVDPLLDESWGRPAAQELIPSQPQQPTIDPQQQLTSPDQVPTGALDAFFSPFTRLKLSDAPKLLASGTASLAREVATSPIPTPGTVQEAAMRFVGNVAQKVNPKANLDVVQQLGEQTQVRDAAFQALQQDIQGSMSPQMQASLQKNWIDRDAEGNLTWGDADVATLLGQTAQSLPGVAAGIGAGGGAAQVLRAGTKGLFRRAGLERLARAGNTAAESRLKKIDAILDAAGYGLGETSVAAPLAEQQVRDQVNALDMATLRHSPRFMEIYDAAQELGPEERFRYARETLANELGSSTGLKVAATTLAAGPIAGPVVGRARRLISAPSAEVAAQATRGRLSNAGVTALEEIGQETVQSGAEGALQALALREAGVRGDQADPYLQAANQAVGGAAAGGLIGGGIGYATGRPRARGATPAIGPSAPAADTPPGSAPGAPPPGGMPESPAAPDAAAPEGEPVNMATLAALTRQAQATEGVDLDAVQQIKQAVLREQMPMPEAAAALREMIRQARPSSPSGDAAAPRAAAPSTEAATRSASTGEDFEAITREAITAGVDTATLRDLARGVLEGRLDRGQATSTVRQLLADAQALRRRAPAPAGAPDAQGVRAQGEPHTAQQPSSTDTTGLAAMGAGMAAGIGANLRDALWASYSKGSTVMAGIDDPALRAAKAAGVPTDDRAAFERFLTDYGNGLGRAGDARPKAQASSALAPLNDLVAHAAQETRTAPQVEGVLAAMTAEQASPSAEAGRFWRDVYPRLNPAARQVVDDYVRGHDFADHTRDSVADVGAFIAIGLPADARSLDPEDRRAVAFMRLANMAYDHISDGQAQSTIPEHRARPAARTSGRHDGPVAGNRARPGDRQEGAPPPAGGERAGSRSDHEPRSPEAPSVLAGSREPTAHDENARGEKPGPAPDDSGGQGASAQPPAREARRGDQENARAVRRGDREPAAQEDADRLTAVPPAAAVESAGEALDQDGRDAGHRLPSHVADASPALAARSGLRLPGLTEARGRDANVPTPARGEAGEPARGAGQPDRLPEQAPAEETAGSDPSREGVGQGAARGAPEDSARVARPAAPSTDLFRQARQQTDLAETSSREPSSAPDAAKVSQVTRWLAPAIARTRGAANTHVVADVTALREATGDPSIPDDVEGVYYAGGRDIYLVASHLPDRETALRKFAHEMFGHLAPEHYGDIDRAVRMVRNLRRMGSKSIGALWDEVAQRDSSLDPVDHAKEVIALMAERGVKNDMMERLLAWARSTLREWGITLDFTEAELRALIARAARALQRDAAEGASSSMDAASPSPSRGPKLHSRADNLAFVSEVMRQLGAVDDLFKNPPSAPTSLIDVFADIPGYLPPETDTDPDAEPGVQRNVTHFTRRIEGGGTDRVPVHIYQRGRDVWIDVSRLRRGEGGDRIYQGIADYARATGRRFIGDPAGLSPDASARRTYHMLSNLLRYGDLKGFEPAREQLEGNAKAGIPPLAWPADNEGRLRSLIKTFYGTLRADFPEITNYGYDFETGQYTDRRGKRLPEDALKHLLAVRGRAVPYRRRAVRAGIFLQSLARLESEARSGVLAEVLRQPERVVQRSKALFSRDGVASTSPLFSRPASTAGQTINSPWQADNDFLREKHKGAWLRARKAFVRWFAPQGLLPDSVFAAKITRDNEFQAVEFDVRHLVGDLEHAIKADFQKKPNQLSEAEQRDLSDALAGRPGPRVPLRTLTAILAMRQYIDTLSGEYAEILGRKIDEKLAGDPDADVERDTRLRDTILGNIGQYVHRSYRAFDDPKWFEKVPDATLNAARTFLQASYVDQGLDAATAKRRAEVALHEILKNGTAYDSFEHFAIESKLGGKDLSVLMQRQQVPPELRALLGEYVDPTINFAKSALKMGRLIWNERFLTRVRALGLGSFLFEGEERPPDATAQLAAEGSEAYAPLNGLWTTPEIAQAFKDALGRENVGDFYRTVIRLNGAVKYSKTVLSPTTAARNFQSAMFFSLANGHFDVRQMRKSLTALREQVLTRAAARSSGERSWIVAGSCCGRGDGHEVTLESCDNEQAAISRRRGNGERLSGPQGGAYATAREFSALTQSSGMVHRQLASCEEGESGGRRLVRPGRCSNVCALVCCAGFG